MVSVKRCVKLGNWHKQSTELGFMELSIHADGKSTNKLGVSEWVREGKVGVCWKSLWGSWSIFSTSKQLSYCSVQYRPEINDWYKTFSVSSNTTCRIKEWHYMPESSRQWESVMEKRMKIYTDIRWYKE